MTNDNNIRHKIVLAALLHDIGKFWQRADQSGMSSSAELSEGVKRLEPHFCPKHKDGYYTHKHVLWTAEFIAGHSQLFKFDDKESEDSLMRLAAMHHNPITTNQKLIQLADWLSSGVDRSNHPDSQKEAEDEKSWQKFKKVKLRSIFESLGAEESLKHKYLLPLKHQDITKNQLPELEVSDGNYQQLWIEFNNEVEKIACENKFVLTESLVQLLCKYTNCIPSSTVHLPDVSLYHHLVSTAGIALCLYDFVQESQQTSSSLRSSHELQPFLLIGGDVSGIQTFIYDIISKNAAKNLKGRSFFLQLIVNSFVEIILHELKLGSTNIIYSSGGGFYILAPNTSHTVDTLFRLEKEFQGKLFSEFSTQLFIALDSEALSCQDFFTQNISEHWKTLSEKLNAKKRQRFKQQMQSNYDSFFEPYDVGGELKLDAITGQPLNKANKQLDDNTAINISTFTQIELGKKLKACDYWVSTFEAIPYWEKVEFDPCNLGYFHYLVGKQDLLAYKDNLKGSVDRRRAMLLNDTNFLDSELQGSDNIYGYIFYGGNDYPTDTDGSPKTFDQLATGTQGINRLGVLRMDIDNLGQLFINGMAKEKRTFSRYSTLSSNLDWFFKGYLNTLWQKETYKDSTQIIYSGGDDLFIVGHWSTLIEMAHEINVEFRKCVCHNPAITLSGGIAIVPPKYPILKGAQEAADAEHLAKEYSFGAKSKNAFALFGFALSWDDEFPMVQELKETIKTHLENGLSKSFISKVMIHYSSVKSFEGHKLSPLRVLWMTAYDFERLKSREKNPENEEFIEVCKRGIYTNQYHDFDCTLKSNYHFLQLLYMACRWADFETR